MAGGRNVIGPCLPGSTGYASMLVSLEQVLELRGCPKERKPPTCYVYLLCIPNGMCSSARAAERGSES